jgi:hypothetical protein
MADDKTSWEAQFDRKLEALERRIDGAVAKLEKRGEVLEKRLETGAERLGEEFGTASGSRSAWFWGLVAITVGLVWLGNNLNWFRFRPPWIPVVLIAAGIYMIISNSSSWKASNGQKRENKEACDE